MVVGGPFGSEVVEEVYLSRAPLVAVLCQARVPGLVSMQGAGREKTLDRIADALSASYPLIEKQIEAQFEVKDGTVVPGAPAPVWRLRSGDLRWQLTIGINFVTLNDFAYVDRDQFLARLERDFGVFGDATGVPHADRLGVRYVNRLDEPEHLLRINELVRAETIGGLGVPRDGEAALARMVCESLYAIEDKILLARWGLLPEGTVIDPSIPPSPRSSWVIDLDSAVEGTLPWHSLVDTARTLATTAYRYFRWVVTDDFIQTFGGPTDVQ